MTIRLNRCIDLTDGRGRPLFMTGGTGLTVEQAARLINTLDLPAYVEARWQITPEAHVSRDRQIAAKIRRLKRLARACGRVVTRVEPTRGFPTIYTALLVR